MTEFKAWQKTTRLESPCVISEKLDGANACVVVEEVEEFSLLDASITILATNPDDASTARAFRVSAQSRTRLALPGQDETGIADWVAQRRGRLALDLGPGYHYGEFVKGKGLKEPKLFLFNTGRWGGKQFTTPGLDVVPVLYEGNYYEGIVEKYLNDLRENGSWVLDSPPEGVVIFWKHDQTLKKAYCSGKTK